MSRARPERAAALKPRPPTPQPVVRARVALAIVAHPDDIEFSAAGTLLLLRQEGYSIHYL